ncbi:hypothetical protein, partial [Roseibacillus persicicus]|uniref:hypothetical protein n=1 Tax=Roseibacillus persicicus TaxID=454148 RepID=UPI0028120E85
MPFPHLPGQSHRIIDLETNVDPIKPSGTNPRSQLGVHLKETSVPLPRQSRKNRPDNTIPSERSSTPNPTDS